MRPCVREETVSHPKHSQMIMLCPVRNLELFLISPRDHTRHSEFTKFNPYDSRIVGVELQPAIGFVAVP